MSEETTFRLLMLALALFISGGGLLICVMAFGKVGA